ncbi:DUF2283 domain-containing protein [Actinokineospora sp. NPDC004072]
MYDEGSDCLYLHLCESADRGPLRQVIHEEVGRGDVVLDFDSTGKVVGIEFIGARELVPARLLSAGEDRQKQGDRSCLPHD